MSCIYAALRKCSVYVSLYLCSFSKVICQCVVYMQLYESALFIVGVYAVLRKCFVYCLCLCSSTKVLCLLYVSMQFYESALPMCQSVYAVLRKCSVYCLCLCSSMVYVLLGLCICAALIKCLDYNCGPNMFCTNGPSGPICSCCHGYEKSGSSCKSMYLVILDMR